MRASNCGPTIVPPAFCAPARSADHRAAARDVGEGEPQRRRELVGVVRRRPAARRGVLRGVGGGRARARRRRSRRARRSAAPGAAATAGVAPSHRRARPARRRTRGWPGGVAPPPAYQVALRTGPGPDGAPSCATASANLVRRVGRVAEWQTRTVQVRVSVRTWEFNSPHAHPFDRSPRSSSEARGDRVFGGSFRCRQYDAAVRRRRTAPPVDSGACTAGDRPADHTRGDRP